MFKKATSAAAIAALFAAPALSQGAPDDVETVIDDADTVRLDTMTVTGYKLQNRQSIYEKANEDRIADFLTADELGRQPDLNVADSLRRLPGVVTIFDEDEGRYVGLRGLDQRYTFISIDGGLIASTDRSDRDINIESIPPTAVKRLEVFKAVTPDLDGQSVGGVINLVTRSAFDADGLYAVGTAQLGWHESVGDLPESFDNPSYRIDAAASNLFANETIGVLLAGTLFEKNRDQGRPIVGTSTNDSGTFINDILPLDYANQIARWNGLAKFEYKPNDDFYIGVTASRFDYQYDEVRYQFRTLESGSDLTQTSPTTGSFSQARGRLRFDRFPLGQTIDNIQIVSEFRPTDRGLLEFGAYYSHGVQGHPYPNISFETEALTGLGYTYDFAGESIGDERLPQINLNDPSVLENPALFTTNTYFDGYFRNEEDVTEFKADYSWNTEGDDAGLGFKVGFKYRNLEKDRFDDSTRYTLTDPEAVLTADQFISNETPYTADYFNFAYPLLSADSFDSFFAANQDLFTAADASNLRSFYDVQEDVTAIYGMGTWNSGPHTLLGGLRFEHTEVATVATLNSGPEQIARTTDYDYLLPSVLYSFDLSEAMKIRAGYAQSIGRPNHPDFAGAETFDEANFSIRRANTALEPREGESFDLAFDWFLGAGQYFSAAAFHKIIDNQISTETTEEEIGGVTFTVTQPVNLDSVSVSGLELSYTDDAFEFLPAPFDGLGIIANLTLMEGEDGPAPGDNLIAQPEMLYNVAGLYNYGPFSAKLTYNFVDDRPTSATRSEYQYDQLDAQFRWQLNERFQLQAEGRNLLNNPRKNFQTDSGRLREINDFGNSYWLGISYKY